MGVLGVVFVSCGIDNATWKKKLALEGPLQDFTTDGGTSYVRSTRLVRATLKIDMAKLFDVR